MPLTERHLTEVIDRELESAELARRVGVLAAIDVAEIPQLRSRFGPKAGSVVTAALGELIACGGQLPEQHAPRSESGFWIFLPETGFYAAHQRLKQLSHQLAETVVDVGGERLRVTPVIGYATFGDATSARKLCEQASAALDAAALRLDLVPVKYSRTLAIAADKAAGPRDGRTRLMEKFWSPVQIGFILSAMLEVPFIAYVLSWRAGFDLTTVTYPLLSAAFAGAAIAIWTAFFRMAASSIDTLATVAPVLTSLEPETGAPSATAIVVAHLASESTTILDTVIALLDHDYPRDLQVILAYSAPDEFQLQESLSELALDPRLMRLRVEGTSTGELVSAALPHVRGEFVGIFGADNHVEAGSFSSAWRWLSTGQDVVQGHRVVRNGGVSWVTRLVAVDYEATQAFDDSERAGLHGFGVFGGPNTYWRTDALRKVGSQRSIQPKEIDSSMRSVHGTFAMVSDPLLLSSELAPTTLRALWKQRTRWAKERQNAQEKPERRTSRSIWMQKIPWLSLQVIPILGFVVWRDGGFGKLNQLILLFVFLAFFVLSVGASQGAFAYLLGNPRVKRHSSWFVQYAFHSAVWFGQFKDLIVRVARYKGQIGERRVRVPRASNETRLSTRAPVPLASIKPTQAAVTKFRPVPPSLPALVDRSYDQLSERERVILCRLSVFAGGWSLGAAEAVVVRDSTDVLAIAEVLGTLIDKGIVQITQSAFGVRFGLPESIRHLAAEKLGEASDEELVIRSAHARFFLKFAERSAQELDGAPTAEWLDRLEVEHDNILAAIGTFLADPSTGSLVLRIIMALFPFFEARRAREWLDAFAAALSIRAGERATTTLTAEALGELGSLVTGPEQRRCLEEALAIARTLGETALTAEILSFLSSCAFHDRDHARCAESAEEAVSIARIVGDQGLLGRALVTRATAVSGEDLLGACALSREAIAVLREAGDRSREAAAMANLATFECYAGELEPAAAHYSEAMLLADELGRTPLVNDILGNMAELAVRKGDLIGAVGLYSRALRGAHREGQRRSCTYLLLGLALCFATMNGAQEEAATLCGAADAQNEQLGFPWEIWISQEREEGEAALRRSMHDQTFQTAYAHGRSLALEDAVAFALKAAGKVPLPPLELTPADKPTSLPSPVAGDGGRRQEGERHASASHPRARRPRAKRG